MVRSFMRAKVCCVCGERVKDTSVYKSYKNSCICVKCFSKLEKTPMNSLFEGTHYLDFLSAPFYYSDMYRRIFLGFKFGGNYALGHIIGMAAEEYFSVHKALREYDCIVPVPLTKAGKRKRGFNQAEMLAEYFSRGISVPVELSLRRDHEKAVQSNLTGAMRAENVSGAFSVCGDVAGKRVLIADDIFTSGSTMNECAKVLCEAGAEDVGGIAAAYVKRPDKGIRLM